LWTSAWSNASRLPGTGTFRGYFTFLRLQASGEELQQLTNLMTVNETYFLREEYQFRCLVDSILPEIVQRRTGSQNAIRIWCIPSSSGEEPYSIAMYLLENWPGISDWDVEIISSDIDTSILRRARAGRYSPLVQHVPARWLEKYFKGVATSTSSATICARQSSSPASISPSPPTPSATATST
jgi:chemotaxis protein methyltransferase CheR